MPEGRMVRFTPDLALLIIESRGCESNTKGVGSCWSDGRDPGAYYGADQICAACLAWAARRWEMTGG
jgi:hypothetical protein